MKAIIVAGGHGSRLFPMTKFTHKTLLPLNGKPIIDYALQTITNAGITDITIIGNKFIDKIYLGWLTRIIWNPKLYLGRILKSFKIIKFFF